MLKGRNLVDPEDFTLEELESIFELTQEIIENEKDFNDVCRGKILAFMSLAREPDLALKLPCLD